MPGFFCEKLFLNSFNNFLYCFKLIFISVLKKFFYMFSYPIFHTFKIITKPLSRKLIHGYLRTQEKFGEFPPKSNRLHKWECRASQNSRRIRDALKDIFKFYTTVEIKLSPFLIVLPSIGEISL